MTSTATPFSLDGRRALVTGAARGIGRALAREVAGDGAHFMTSQAINVTGGVYTI